MLNKELRTKAEQLQQSLPDQVSQSIVNVCPSSIFSNELLANKPNPVI